MRAISTKAKGWQKLCWELVQAGVALEIPDVTPKQILFLQGLCAAYRYKHKILGNKLQIFLPPPATGEANGEIEAELRRLLPKITDSKKQPDKEVMGICYRYITLCLETEKLSEKAIEIADRILDVMEISAKLWIFDSATSCS
jgi:hypothetical protein